MGSTVFAIAAARLIAAAGLLAVVVFFVHIVTEDKDGAWLFMAQVLLAVTSTAGVLAYLVEHHDAFGIG